VLAAANPIGGHYECVNIFHPTYWKLVISLHSLFLVGHPHSFFSFLKKICWCHVLLRLRMIPVMTTHLCSPFFLRNTDSIYR
jgi:hypothetical protein